MKNILGVLIMFSISLSLVAKNCEEPISKDRFDLIYKSLTIKKNDQQRYQLVLAYAKRECLSAEQMNSFLELFSYILLNSLEWGVMWIFSKLFPEFKFSLCVKLDGLVVMIGFCE